VQHNCASLASGFGSGFYQLFEVIEKNVPGWLFGSQSSAQDLMGQDSFECSGLALALRSRR
jgi:hypothetical protein